MPGSGSHGRRLSMREREEIAWGLAAGKSQVEIARAIGFSPATVSRELARTIGAGPQARYRASTAQAAADARARRPGLVKLAVHTRLRAEVEARLEHNESPEQISMRLRREFPDDPEMQVSHETIYTSLYVQGRGALRRDLAGHLRTGRAVRHPRAQGRARSERAGSPLREVVSISQRPPEVADRAVPGHWEGDLIMGAGNASAIGTLVERATRYLILLHLPGDHTAPTVARAMCEQMAHLPEQLRLTLTWDRGSEMANHAQIAQATGLDIYFCDPASPWQRGTNENTNGLLRQYFPKRSDLRPHTQADLDAVAAELNGRPRQTLGFRSPSQVLDEALR